MLKVHRSFHYCFVIHLNQQIRLPHELVRIFNSKSSRSSSSSKKKSIMPHKKRALTFSSPITYRPQHIGFKRIYFRIPSCCNTDPWAGLEASLAPEEANMADREDQTASWLWAASTGAHIPVISTLDYTITAEGPGGGFRGYLAFCSILLRGSSYRDMRPVVS